MAVVRVVPLEGYELRAMGGDEWLVVASGDSSRNVIVDTGAVTQVLRDGLAGRLGHGFDGGYGTMWTIGEFEES